MSKYNLNAYYLKKYANTTGNNKSATLSLQEHLPSVCHSINIGSIKLDEEDINCLLEKYKISDLQQKEIEQEAVFKRFNEIQDEIKFLREGLPQS